MNRRLERDFEAYVRWRQEWTDSFVPTPSVPKPERGNMATVEAFRLWDTEGRITPCDNPEQLVAAMEGKGLLNWQIKQWAEEVRDLAGILTTLAYARLEEIQGEFSWLPDWVWKATWKQAGLRLEWRQNFQRLSQKKEKESS